MTYLATIGTIMILGFLYWRMVKREIPQPVGWLQALLPIAIGMLSHPLTIPFSMGYMKALANNPDTLKLSELNFFQALGRDFILAGGLEEIAKLVIIVVILLIFRKKVKNVYEYILIGACVGIGFTLIEEFTYSTADDANIVSTIGRLISVPAHMTLNMTGKGSTVLNYVLALLVPMVIHTLYDVSTAFNPSLMRGEVKGMIIALIGYVCLLVYELVVLLRCKKKTAELCGMSTLAEV